MEKPRRPLHCHDRPEAGETKRETIDGNFVKSLWPVDDMGFMEVGSEGSAGGLLCIWNTQIFQLVDCCSTRNFILLSGCSRRERVLLMEDGRDWGPKPFRFINAWTSHPQFKKEVEKVWEEVQIQGWASFRIMIKLKRLRAYLRRWNMEVFGNIDDLLKQAEDELHEWDLKAESRSLLEPEVNRRREIRSQVWQLSRSKERMWLQKSRMSWAQNGDKNTRLFHLMASNRQRKNLLDSVQVNGVAVEDPSIVKQVVENYFTRVFAESWESRPKLAGSFLAITDVDSKEVLEANFSEAEIWAAIQDCDGNKAPGPDGFNLHCIQKCWSIMKGEFMQLFQEFHRNGKLAKGVNSSFITLIPKKKNPLDLSDFRPISLVSSIYKVLAKVLSRRIRQVLPKLIGEVQTAFLSGRCILDGVLIANEVVDWWRKTKKKGIILKLDFEKAYDSVNWEFLLSMMENFGFGDKWVGWIRSCISTSRISVLVNGSPTAEFSPQRGLRQGDPLSPFLFTMVAEGLNILLERAKEQGMIRGASVGHQDFIISHLQFADDTIIFCEANWDEIREVIIMDENLTDQHNLSELENTTMDAMMRDWTNLPSELLSLILSHLFLYDIKRFRNVCKTWQSVPSQQVVPSPIHCPIAQSHWLLFFRGYKMPSNFYSPLYGDTYQMAIPPELSGAVLRFSNNGWLLMSRDCTVFGILGLFNDIAWFSSISRGEESWTWAKVNSNLNFQPSHTNPVFYNELFYCLGQDCNLGVFNPKEKDSSWTVLDGPKKPRGCDSVYESYLMECDGKLLSVFVGNRGRGVSVYTLDESEMAWQRVTDLGSKMLFVSHSTSFSSTKVVEGMENKIHFPRFCGKDGVFYCLATSRYGSFGSNIRKKDLRGTEEQLHCSWIEPITGTYTEEELNWLAVAS
ncbi:unnamed protein product [Camellia sinensis]